MAASGRSSGGVKHLLAWGWLGALWLTAFAICLLAWAWRGIG